MAQIGKIVGMLLNKFIKTIYRRSRKGNNCQRKENPSLLHLKIL